MKHIILSLLVLAAPISTRAAFNPAIVPEDARWVVHGDLIALRESHLGQALLAAMQDFAPKMQEGKLHADFEKILATAGTFTAYGSSFSKDPKKIDGILVLQGTTDLRKIAEGFVAQATVAEPEKVTELKGLPFEAYSLEGGLTVAFPKEPIILFSKSTTTTHLTKAYDVFRGVSPSLAKKPSSTLRSLLPTSGNHFLLAASEMPTTEGLLSEESPHSRVLKMATAAAFAIGEEDTVTAARLQLVASSDDMAEKLNRILPGLAALASLASSDDEDLAAFLQSITTDRKGNSVSISLAYPSDRLVELVQEIHRDATMSHQQGSAPHSPEPASTEGIGEVIGTWNADADLPGDAPTAENLTSRSFEQVALENGATITISGRRGGGEHARIDFVEIAPSDGSGSPMRYEAEYMRLKNYQIEGVNSASEGEIIRLENNKNQGQARFRYQGPTGTYRVTVGYCDESDGQSSFALGVQSATATLPEALTTSGQ